MSRPRLLDLFCGAGGCSVGYHRAGFDVVGVDIQPQKRYPYPFIRENAMAVMTRFVMGGIGATAVDSEGRHWSLEDFHAIHASPPCQRYSVTRHWMSTPTTSKPARLPNAKDDHADLVDPTRTLLEACALPWIMENVPGAPLASYSAMLCGLMFDLKVLRHRLFESSFLLMTPRHPSHRGIRIGEGGFCSVAGNGGGHASGWGENRRPVVQNAAMWRTAMGIDWMSRDELAQAIPPAYTEYLGRQLINVVTS